MANQIEFKPVVDIITPTYDNLRIFQMMVTSLYRNTSLPYRLFCVNNHQRPIAFDFGGFVPPNYHVLQQEENKGWTGGLNAGLDAIEKDYGGMSDYVLFCNDDVRFLDCHYDWLPNMVNILERYPEVGAVGPASNNVMFYQSLNHFTNVYHEVPILSGFCMLVRKQVIERIGRPDDTLFGGDDLDYSIRMRDAGYKLICCRQSFVYHHYAQTGKRLYKDWDSKDWSDKINQGLIKKHGFEKYQKMVRDPFHPEWTEYHLRNDMELDTIHKVIMPVNGHKIYDLGCGNKKVVPEAIGVDAMANGKTSVSNRVHPNQCTDVVADLNYPLPFEDNDADYIVAKHILEHITDYLKALVDWKRILKPGGKLIIAVPDADLCQAIACDPSHVHAFTGESLRTALEMCGYEIEKQSLMTGAFSFITVAKKPEAA